MTNASAMRASSPQALGMCLVTQCIMVLHQRRNLGLGHRSISQTSSIQWKYGWSDDAGRKKRLHIKNRRIFFRYINIIPVSPAAEDRIFRRNTSPTRSGRSYLPKKYIPDPQRKIVSSAICSVTNSINAEVTNLRYDTDGMAEREGFEPSKPFWGLRDFESRAFDHSAISPADVA